jgi:hypothetical protein
LALDKNDLPHISYNDLANYDVRYAWHNGATWYTETVDSGTAPSLALDQAGHPHISYSNDDGLKYAWHDGTNWYVETAENLDNTVAASLALDSLGRPHIGYFDYANEALKYARFDGLVWRIETMDDTTGLNYHIALALDEADQPHISYYDAVNGDLRYARLILPTLFLDKQATPSNGLRNNEPLTYTLTLSGPGLHVHLWDPLPPFVRYVSDSITGTVTPTAVYSPTVHAVIWQDTLPTDTVQTVRFQVTPGITGTGSLLLAPPLVNTAWLTETQRGRSVSATAIVNGWRVYVPLILRQTL